MSEPPSRFPGFPCDLCTLHFPTKTELTNHLRKTHEALKVLCILCVDVSEPVFLLNDKNLRDHLVLKHKHERSSPLVQLLDRKNCIFLSKNPNAFRIATSKVASTSDPSAKDVRTLLNDWFEKVGPAGKPTYLDLLENFQEAALGERIDAVMPRTVTSTLALQDIPSTPVNPPFIESDISLGTFLLQVFPEQAVPQPVVFSPPPSSLL